MISLSLDIHIRFGARWSAGLLCVTFTSVLSTLSLSLLSLTIITLESGLSSQPKNDSVLLLPAKP